MKSRTRESRSPPKLAGALFILAVLGCPSGRNIRTDTTRSPEYFRREGNEFHARLRNEAAMSTVLSPDVVVIGLLDTSSGGRNLTYIPSELHIVRGTPTLVNWVSWDGHFTLTFTPYPPGSGQKSPLEGGKTEVDSHPSGALNAAAARVSGDAPTGRYHFTVVLTTPDGPPYKDPDCPPIIIQVPVPSP
jgi:hypothetical protein